MSDGCVFSYDPVLYPIGSVRGGNEAAWKERLCSRIIFNLFYADLAIFIAFRGTELY